MLAAGANVHVLSGETLVVDNQEESTDGVSMRDLLIHGNRANQTQNGLHNGLNWRRHQHHSLSHVRIEECDGDGYYSTGKSEVGDLLTRVTRPLHHTDVTIERCTGWGYNSSATNRQVHVKGLHVEKCGDPTTGNGGGALLDHSEDIVHGITARQLRG